MNFKRLLLGSLTYITAFLLPSALRYGQVLLTRDLRAERLQTFADYNRACSDTKTSACREALAHMTSGETEFWQQAMLLSERAIAVLPFILVAFLFLRVKEPRPIANVMTVTILGAILSRAIAINDLHVLDFSFSVLLGLLLGIAVALGGGSRRA
ncbi:hypothetical protein [Celeribacter naphthalenivorans]|uniref:hypothetical protein n=1 Tax=Celeribacter naphthalenivorans TaxID=1614694 RepID=UPI001CFA7E1F|nr:hypothetical protein [Celeribacter naphthalenivorans]